METGKRIREARKAKGWTQEQLAKESGISLMSIRRYESSAVSISVEQLQRIAKALGVFEGYLLTGDPACSTAWDDFADVAVPAKPTAQQIGQAYEKATPPVQRTVEVALEPFMDKAGDPDATQD